MKFPCNPGGCAEEAKLCAHGTGAGAVCQQQGTTVLFLWEVAAALQLSAKRTGLHSPIITHFAVPPSPKATVEPQAPELFGMSTRPLHKHNSVLKSSKGKVPGNPQI